MRQLVFAYIRLALMNIGLVYKMISFRSSLFLILAAYSLNCAAVDLLVDPTMPAGFKATTSTIAPIKKTNSSPQWSLDSTIISPYQRIAVINGKHLTIGEEINEATLVNIEHQQVELLQQDKLIVLSVKKSFISQLKSTTQ